MLPKIAAHMSRSAPAVGGWLTGLLGDLLDKQGIELAVCFPMHGEKTILQGRVGNLVYYGFPQGNTNPTKYDDAIEKYLKNILDDYLPDIVHIFGTEYPHSLAMTKVFKKPHKTVISIQGLTSIYAKHYTANLPFYIQRRYTFRDMLKQDNILTQRENFYKRGEYEIEALNNVNHIIGRTTWDKACSLQINPKANYHFCNETLRDEFYKHKWRIDKCEKYSIFISQCSYPIKGFHYMLEAMPIILKTFPDVHVYLTGQNPLKLEGLIKKMKISSYQLYIKELIMKFNLTEKVTFLGELKEEEMCERFLASHVFVSPSSIENSPNSVGEAMILGVPTVTSDVGGVKDMLIHNIDGFIYQADAPYMLAHHVCEIFKDDEIALRFSENSIKHAMQTHSKRNNTNNMLQIYETILSERM